MNNKKNSLFIGVSEIAFVCDVSKSTAQKIIKNLNIELQKMGKLFSSGKTQRKFFYKKIYCGNEYKYKEKIFYTAEDLSKITGMSKSFFYSRFVVINLSLAEKGYFVINGRIPKKYFEKEMLYNE